MNLPIVHSVNAIAEPRRWLHTGEVMSGAFYVFPSRRGATNQVVRQEISGHVLSDSGAAMASIGAMGTLATHYSRMLRTEHS